MFCKNCGKEIDDKAFVCPNCGVKVDNAETNTDNASHRAKIKKGFNIAANVCAIVFMGILMIGGFILLSAIMELGEQYSEYADTSSFTIATVTTVCILVFAAATIIVSAFALAKGNGNKGFGLKIAVIAMIGVVAVFEFIGGGIVYGILCLIPIGFEIANLCIKA